MNPQPAHYVYNNPYAPVISPNIVEVLVIILLVVAIIFLMVRMFSKR